MPIRCVEFSGWLGWLAASFIISIIISIVSYVINGFGIIGIFLTKVLWGAFSVYSAFIFFNMIATVTGLRGNCSQGYRSGWPPVRGSIYHRDPATGLRTDDIEKPLW